MLGSTKLNKFDQEYFKNICRLCLIDGDSLREICGTKLPFMIKYCLDIKIVKREQLPTHICVRCFRQIINFYTFKRKVDKNDQILKNVIQPNSKPRNTVNIAFKKSSIAPVELNKIQKVGAMKDSPIHKQLLEKTIKNKCLKPGNNLKESQYKDSSLHAEQIHYDKTQDICEKANNILSADLDTFQKKQKLCFTYNVEPPPLIPLQLDSNKKLDTNEEANSLLECVKDCSSYLKNCSKTNILLPPPLVPICPSRITSDVSRRNINSLTNYHCDICGKEFESLSYLNEHTIKSDCNLTPHHECNICGKQFLDQKKLIVHLKGHRITKEYLCNICGKKYLSPSTFRIHFRCHTGERPFKCNICSKGFVRWAAVKNHMVTHEDFKPYKCETCGRQFKVISNLYRHQRLHTGSYLFSCTYCSKAFIQSDHLKLHIRTYHTNEKPYLCCECGKGFVSSQRLKRHELVHSGRKPHQCPLCLQGYANAIDLKNHNIRVHRENGNKDELKKYACSICGFKFRHPCRLTRHMKTHNDPKKNCPTCKISFKGAQALTRHLKTSGCKN